MSLAGSSDSYRRSELVSARTGTLSENSIQTVWMFLAAKRPMAAKPNDSRSCPRRETLFIRTSIRAPLKELRPERNLLRAAIAYRP